MPRQAFAYQLSSGKTVVLAELTTGEHKQSLQLAGNDKNVDARQFAQSLEALRLAVRRIDDREVSYEDLAGPKLDELFSMKEILALLQVQGVMLGVDEQEEDIAGKLKAVAGGI